MWHRRKEFEQEKQEAERELREVNAVDEDIEDIRHAITHRQEDFLEELESLFRSRSARHG